MHTHARGTYARRGKPCRRGAAFAAASGINARTAGVPGIRDRALPADVARQAEPLMCTHMSGGRSQGQALPSWRSLRTRYEMHGEQVLTCTHLSVEHTLAGASPAVVALSLTCCENRDVCDLKRTHLSVEHTLAGGKPCRRGTVFDVPRE